MGGGWVHLLGAQEVRVRVILVLHECILNAFVVHLVLPTFDVTNSLGFPPRLVAYQLGSILETASRFLAGTVRSRPW